ALVGLALARLAHCGERFEQELLERLPVLEPLPELGALRAELVVAERRELGLERGDVVGLLGQALEAPTLAEAENLFEVAELRRHQQTGYRLTRWIPGSPRGRRRAGARGRRTTRAAARAPG